MPRAAITGWGRYVPPAVLTNHELATVVDTSHEWIVTRSGIEERRVSHVSNADMATAAASEALAAAGVDPSELDHVIVATCTADRQIPAMACYVQTRLGALRAAAVDINAGCSGFLYGLDLADGLIAAGRAARVLVVGSEKITPYIDLEERTTAVLFGDAAGAVVLEPATGDEGILSINVGANGALADALTAEGAGTEFIGDDARLRIVMDGREVFRNAVSQMPQAALLAIKEAGLQVEDVDLVIPHQANQRIIDAVAKRLELPFERVYSNIARYGNTSAASIPVALAEVFP